MGKADYASSEAAVNGELTTLLGDMGAEVIKIEDPEHGDDTREWEPFVGGWSTYGASDPYRSGVGGSCPRSG